MATGISHDAYVSHTAVRLLARFGFHTNEIRRSTVRSINEAERTQATCRPSIGAAEALIYAAVITQTIPLLLEEGEQLVKRPSLAAGNDAGSPAGG